MRSRKSLLISVAVMAVLLLQLVSCDFEPKDVVFYVWEEKWEDGRHVMCHYDDSLFSHGLLLSIHDAQRVLQGGERATR